MLDPILLTLGTYLLLKLFRHPERFLQTATAVLGTGTLLGLLLFMPLQLILSAIGARSRRFKREHIRRAGRSAAAQSGGLARRDSE